MENNQTCNCYQIEKEIRNEYPDADWNCDDACFEWNDRCKELKNNNIQFEDGADENYGCTCPTCGRFICGWCV